MLHLFLRDDLGGIWCLLGPTDSRHGVAVTSWGRFGSTSGRFGVGLGVDLECRSGVSVWGPLGVESTWIWGRFGLGSARGRFGGDLGSSCPPSFAGRGHWRSARAGMGAHADAHSWRQALALFACEPRLAERGAAVGVAVSACRRAGEWRRCLQLVDEAARARGRVAQAGSELGLGRADGLSTTDVFPHTAASLGTSGARRPHVSLGPELVAWASGDRKRACTVGFLKIAPNL